MIRPFTRRPRNVDTIRAASILYGDLGTSKAYVLGLAFALSGYQSPWYIFLVSFLILLVGSNYLIICKCYPYGGGAYSAARRRSEILALIGGFFLIADYLVTAALSALSALNYLVVPYPEYCTILALILIGALNYYGPKRVGTFSSIIAIIAVACVVTLGLFTVPHLLTAVEALQPLEGPFIKDWTNFTGIIVALSGIEAIANITGVMKLDRGATEAHADVSQTAKPAILIVIFEVVFFTSLFGLAMLALPNIQLSDHVISAPGYPNVRDFMLRYMAEVYVGLASTPLMGQIAGMIVGTAFSLLLLSATNTAIAALVSLIFVMARDGELPEIFLKLNKYGVPTYGLLFSTLVPIVLIYFVHDVVGLADLYAVGFIGAIVVNLASTSTDKALPITKPQRTYMLLTCLFLFAIEVTLLITKPHARNFVTTLFACGLVLRGLVLEQRQRQLGSKPPTEKGTQEAKLEEFISKESHFERLKVSTNFTFKSFRIADDTSITPLHSGPVLCTISFVGKTLEFTLQECKAHKLPLYVLYVSEQPAITERDLERSWTDDPKACAIFDYIVDHRNSIDLKFIYIVSDDTAATIVDTAVSLNVSKVIMGIPRGLNVARMIRGNIMRDVLQILPENIDLITIC